MSEGAEAGSGGKLLVEPEVADDRRDHDQETAPEEPVKAALGSAAGRGGLFWLWWVAAGGRHSALVR